MFDWAQHGVTYKSALAFNRVDIAAIAAGQQGVHILGDGQSRPMVRKAATFLEDPDMNNLFNNQYLKTQTIKYPPIFIGSWRNAALLGFRTIITEDGSWVNDMAFLSQQEEDRFLLNKKKNFGEDSFLAWDDSQAVFRAQPAFRKRHQLSGTTISLTSSEASNYGSFIFRVIPKLLAAQQLGFAADLRILVYAREPTFKQLLVLAGVKEEQIIHHDPRCIYECEHLINISNRNPAALLDPESRALFAQIRDKVLNELGPQKNPSRRLYVSRYSPDKPQKRRMLNEAEVTNRLKREGFQIFDPHGKDISEQIRMFGEADMVVGPSGSGMFNCVFCREGTRLIDIESEPHWIFAHTALFGSCGLKFGILQGSAVDHDWTVHHKDWVTNVDALISLVRNFS